MFRGYVTIAIHVKHLAQAEKLELTNSKKEEKHGREGRRCPCDRLAAAPGPAIHDFSNPHSN